MAVRLYLDNQEVVIDSSQEIRITRENPYFSLSDSYTLDVSIPLSILQNARFFGNIQKIEKQRVYREFSCKLYNSSTLLMEGTARIVQSTDLAVKVQLACGVSALKMSSEQEGLYIDNIIDETEGGAIQGMDLDYGPTGGVNLNHSGYGIPLLDSSNDIMVNVANLKFLSVRGCQYVSECPKLLDIARLVAKRLGFTIDMTTLPAACNNMYVVTATSGSVKRKVPHWTVKEFFKQFQNFFGGTFVRTGVKSLKLVPLRDYINNPVTEIDPLDEFQTDYSEDNDTEGIMNRNVEFEFESAEYEVVDEEILGKASYVSEYSDVGSMDNAFNSDSEEVKMRKIYKTNGEMYVGWKTGDNPYQLIRVAPFNPLKRFDGAQTESLKISPVLIEEDVECEVNETHDLLISPYVCSFNISVPSVSNPYGKIVHLDYTGQSETTQDESPTLQGLIEGTESVIDEEDKPDIMKVAFIDGRKETVVARTDAYGGQAFSHDIHLAFTDYNFKKQLTNNRSKWSFSLNSLTGYDFYLGQLHQMDFRCSSGVKHIFRFLSETIPEADNVFYVNGKQYACEKIEATIRNGELDNLMTGYFHEISQVPVPVL